MIDDLLEELNVPTYNKFSCVQFWEVLQGLVKIFIVERDLEERRQLERAKKRKQERKQENNENSNYTDNNSVDLDDEEEQQPRPLQSRWSKEEIEIKVQLHLDLAFEQLDTKLKEVADI